GTTFGDVGIPDGTDFADVARKYSHGPMASEGGTWPLMAKDNFAKKTIEAVAFQLEEGEVSGVVDYDEGWAIVRAREVEPAHVRPFEAVQQELEETIRQRREAKLRGEYFEELQDQTSMWESEEGFLAAVDQAVRRFRGR
ncbi:MAG: peptidylprolyl isomerase, partial [Planctomycetota bacterium]